MCPGGTDLLGVSHYLPQGPDCKPWEGLCVKLAVLWTKWDRGPLSWFSSLRMNDTPSGRPVRICDIAKALGVSQMTVSLAMRSHPRISHRRREQILETAKQMGYQPNAMAVTLAHYRHGGTGYRTTHSALAWLNFWQDPKKLRDHREYDGYWRGAFATAEKFGFHLEEFAWKPDGSPGRLRDILTARGITGILLPPHKNIVPELGDFPWDRFSIVRFGRTVSVPCTHLVTADQAANSVTAFNAMRSLGYERIGLATYLTSHMFFDAGFLKAQCFVPKALRLPIFMMNSGDAAAKNQREFNHWLKAQRPDAIITDIPNIVNMISEAGLRIPEDIGVAGTSIPDTGVDAGIYQHPEEIGRVALLLLIGLIHDNDRGIPALHRETLVKGKWVDGSSLPRRAIAT